MDRAPPVLHLRLTMLLHDIGKPACFSLGEDGQGHFYGHARESVRMAGEILRRLRYPKALTQQVETLIRYHDSVLEEDRIRRWLNKLGEETFFDLLAVQRADTAALAPAFCTRLETLGRLEETAREILSETPCLRIRDLAVNGHDLMALGLAGRAIGSVQRHILDQILEGKLSNQKEEILGYLQEYFRKNPNIS